MKAIIMESTHCHYKHNMSQNRSQIQALRFTPVKNIEVTL